jgi:tripartite-type tricarboxylate transporter receptor subunit TctC
MLTKICTDAARKNLVFVVVLAAVLAGEIASSMRVAAAQTSEPIYRGKQIRMVIGNTTGSSYDTYARVLAQHMTRHIPGSPIIINQNMPVAASMQATNWAFEQAPKDGTVIAAVYNSVLPEPLYGNPSARYDPRRFEYVGSISKQQNVCGTWHTHPVKTLEQAKSQQVIVTASGSASDSAILPRIFNVVLGTKFKVVLGYATQQARLAIERGEADGACGWSWSTLKTTAPEWTRQRLLNIFAQTGAKRQADLPDVPLVVELVTNPDDRQAIELLSFQQEMGRPFLMPPSTPGNMVAIMRRAFDDTMKDPLFLDSARKALMEVEPMTGEEMERAIRNAFATPKALLQRAMELHGGSAQQ